MTALVLGLLLFLGLHSSRIVAEGARSRFIAQRGPRAWRGLYSLGSAVGLVLIIWGYSLARHQSAALWSPPAWTRPLAAALMLVSFVLLAAAYVPGNGIKARVGHPMLLSVQVWAAAHLLANPTLADLLLFGAFLLWAVFCFRNARARDRAEGRSLQPGRVPATVTAMAAGFGVWCATLLWLHRWLFGASPLS
jgi:uncharacterized membrane protein